MKKVYQKEMILIHFSKEKEYINCLKGMDGTIFHNQIIRVKERKKIQKNK